MKNWLIRTKNNHILGPVSRDKVLELIQQESLKPQDEICSGNGFWFYIRETELLERYLKSNEPQGFNPVSEADDSDLQVQQTTAIDLNKVGLNDEEGASSVAEKSEQVKLPAKDDLEYPNAPGPKVKAKAAQPSTQQLSTHQEVSASEEKSVESGEKAETQAPMEDMSSTTSSSVEAKFPSAKDLEYPDVKPYDEMAYQRQVAKNDSGSLRKDGEAGDIDLGRIETKGLELDMSKYRGQNNKNGKK